MDHNNKKKGFQGFRLKPLSGVPGGGLEPPHDLTRTGSLVLRVYQFHHLGEVVISLSESEFISIPKNYVNRKNKIFFRKL